MNGLTWSKRWATRWESGCGHKILKYKMTPTQISYLLYMPEESLECGDYSSHDSLAKAKETASATI